MRDSVSAEARIDDDDLISIPTIGRSRSTWRPAGLSSPSLSVSRAPCRTQQQEHDHLADHWRQAFDVVAWRTAVVEGNIDLAWQLWNKAATASLGVKVHDRGTLNVALATSPDLKKDPDAIQDLTRRYDLEQAWFQAQDAAIDMAHWPSAAGPYVSTHKAQLEKLEQVRLEASRARQKASRDSWNAYVKQGFEESPGKLFKWVRGTTKVWDLAIQTGDSWAASPGAVAQGELHAWSKLWKVCRHERQVKVSPFRIPEEASLGSLWDTLSHIKKGKAVGADQWTAKELRALGCDSAEMLSTHSRSCSSFVNSKDNGRRHSATYCTFNSLVT
eukprot:2588109-Amphidinium_carterae.2